MSEFFRAVWVQLQNFNCDRLFEGRGRQGHRGIRTYLLQTCEYGSSFPKRDKFSVHFEEDIEETLTKAWAGNLLLRAEGSRTCERGKYKADKTIECTQVSSAKPKEPKFNDVIDVTHRRRQEALNDINEQGRCDLPHMLQTCKIMNLWGAICCFTDRGATKQRSATATILFFQIAHAWLRPALRATDSGSEPTWNTAQKTTSNQNEEKQKKETKHKKQQINQKLLVFQGVDAGFKVAVDFQVAGPLALHWTARPALDCPTFSSFFPLPPNISVFFPLLESAR